MVDVLNLTALLHTVKELAKTYIVVISTTVKGNTKNVFMAPKIWAIASQNVK